VEPRSGVSIELIGEGPSHLLAWSSSSSSVPSAFRARREFLKTSDKSSQRASCACGSEPTVEPRSGVSIELNGEGPSQTSGRLQCHVPTDGMRCQGAAVAESSVALPCRVCGERPSSVGSAGLSDTSITGPSAVCANSAPTLSACITSSDATTNGSPLAEEAPVTSVGAGLCGTRSSSALNAVSITADMKCSSSKPACCMIGGRRGSW